MQLSKPETNHDVRVKAFVDPNEKGRLMLMQRDLDKKKRLQSAMQQKYTRNEIISTDKLLTQTAIEQKLKQGSKPGIAQSVVRDQSETEIGREDLKDVYPTPLNLSMEYQQKRMSRPMPALFQHILKQQRFEKDYDTKLEIKSRIQKKMQEVDALKAQGLSVKEIEMENEGASAILEYLKEHERKLSEKKAVNKVIKENE